MTEKAILCSIGRISRAIDKVWKRIETSGIMTLGDIQVDHDYIEDCFQQISQYQDKMEQLEIENDTLYNEAIAIYLKTKAKLRDLELKILNNDDQPKNLELSMSQLVSQQKTFFEEMKDVRGRNPVERDIRLPKLQIPAFSGDPKTWLRFYDLFKVTVHENTRLSKAQKLQYLQSFLQGQAESTISHLLTQDENSYDEAWEKLTNRYHRTGLMVYSFVEMFIEQPVIQIPTESNIRKLADISDESLRGLRALAKEERDHFLIYWLVKKLDKETKQLWAREVNGNETPNINELIEFLNKRANELMLTEPKSKQKRDNYETKVSSHHSSNTNSSQCPLCKQDHAVYRCDQFRLMDISSRYDTVKQNKLCNNCLHRGHMMNNCKSKNTCFLCKGRHHSMLHTSSQPSVNTYHASPEPIPQHFTPHIQSSELQLNNTVHNAQNYALPLNRNQTTHIDATKLAVMNDQLNLPAVGSILSQQQIQSNAQPTTAQSTALSTALSTAQSTAHASSQQSNVSSLQLNHSIDCLSNSSSRNTIALLPTAIILIKDFQGIFQPCRALLDSGSQATFITAACAQKLRLAISHAKIPITGLGAAGAGTTKGLVHLSISSTVDHDFITTTNALILTRLTSSLPAFTFNNLKLTIPSDQLADPTYNTSSAIDVIIGANLFFDILLPELIKGTSTSPSMQRTVFGWVLSGHANFFPEKLNSLHSMVDQIQESDIDVLLRKFWELEELSTPNQSYETEEENSCEVLYRETTKRDETGRYIVQLPIKSNLGQLGNSYDVAVARLKYMERKFKYSDDFAAEYKNFIDEYERLGHMTAITPEINDNEHERFYLPHHAVIKETSTSTRLRVVFDGSAKSSTQLSINNKLMVGPTVQPTLTSILMKFRCFPVVFAADITKMYRQILIESSQRRYQRIVWRSNPSESIQQYELNTITYGMSSSPFLATRTLLQIAEDNMKQFPAASKIIKHNFYVDDLMAGAMNEIEAAQLIKEISMILESAGMDLRKWKASHPATLSNIPDDHQDKANLKIQDDENSIKVLGIYWNHKHDHFSFVTQPTPTTRWTKRSLLSDAAKTFDPLGWLAPVVIKIKILFQVLWLEKLNWDDALPDNIESQWLQIRHEFVHLNAIKIPRCITNSFDKNNQFQVHGFCDASNKAYAAVVYLRTITLSGKICVRIISAKTKVAPIKIVSIPRLELCAAALLSKHVTNVLHDISIPISGVYLWTDSTTVLAWLSKHPRDWKPFVANRVNDIIEHHPRKYWNYVKSGQNPADVASRGINPVKLQSWDMWWNGSSILYNLTVLASNLPEYDHDVVTSEMKKSSLLSHIIHTQTHHFSTLVEKISTWTKLVNVVSYFFRFVDAMFKRRTSSTTRAITTKESQFAILKLMLYIQQSDFSDEISLLKRQKSIPASSKLFNLTPILDKDGLLRIGGRLQNSLMSEGSKHPIILPKNHPVATMLVNYYHKSNLHSGPALTTHILRQHYWIIDCRRLVNKYCNKCIVCFRYKSHQPHQVMGNLPASRIQPSRRAFMHVGIDFAGPISTKLMKVRNSKTFKSYVCVFVCFTSKAIHLEALSDLSTECFLATLNRFVGRRGIPAKISSDNAKTFVGAKNEILRMLKHPDVITYSTEHQIDWQFITPLCPYQGDLWEAGVRSMKHHLKRVTHNQVFTFEELTTILCQIESTLNSRPLCALTSDPDDINILTPGHILIGEPLRSLPQPNHSNYQPSTLGHYERVQHLVQSFWLRWRLEYLNTLQQRVKWQTTQPSLSVGDIVILKEDNVPPGIWKLGRILAQLTSPDNNHRNYEVKTESGIYKRNITKLIKLPIETIPSECFQGGDNV